MCACRELGGHLRIHGDHDFPLLGHEGVALFDLFVDPVLKSLAEDRSTQINNILFWNFGEVDFVWQVLADAWLVPHEVHDLLKCQVFILWHMSGLDFVVLQISFSS